MRTKTLKGKFTGVIIEESLSDAAVLKGLKISKTTVEKTTPEFKTPWLKKWTLHAVEFPEGDAEKVAKLISQALESEHGTSWYADFKNGEWHYVVFKGKTFKVNRAKPEEYERVAKYGVSKGIPGYQLDFSKDINEWKKNQAKA